ncbi:hypothetical protein [Clostridium paraputrificum]|uniref:WxL domain-containing protein n=1 Tax=Clostridium paraputrificum TaxID=29363 RepID=A0A6N3F075_9CLOT
MKLRKLLLMGLISSGMVIGGANITSAAEFGSNLVIEAKPTTVNVTVPSTAPMVFNEDGTNTLPSAFTLTNNSEIGGVSLTNINLVSPKNAWSLLPNEADLKVQPKDQKKIKLHIGKTGAERLIAPGSTASQGSASFSLGEISIPAKGSETLKFKVERGAFSQAVAEDTAFNMTLTFEFN